MQFYFLAILLTSLLSALLATLTGLLAGLLVLLVRLLLTAATNGILSAELGGMAMSSPFSRSR
jgi:hypothetical protein